MHPAWLPAAAFAPLGARRVRVIGEGLLADTVRAEVTAHGELVTGDADVVLEQRDGGAPEAFELARRGGVTTVVAGGGPGLLYGLFHLVRLGEEAFVDRVPERHAPAHDLRMLDHWDNVDVHPVMGQVERGYAGGSIFYVDGRVRTDLSRVAAYGRLLAAIGVNRVAINNVNVHRREARLLTDDLPDVARIADVLRPWGSGCTCR